MRLAKGPLRRLLADRADRARAISRRSRFSRRAAGDAGNAGNGKTRHRRPKKGLRGQISRVKAWIAAGAFSKEMPHPSRRRARCAALRMRLLVDAHGEE